MWELTVGIDHTFTVAVGNHDVLVHNMSCPVRDAFDELDPDDLNLGDGVDADALLTNAQRNGANVDDLADALRKRANGESLSPDELEALYRATVGTPGDIDFARRVADQSTWDPVDNRWRSASHDFDDVTLQRGRDSIDSDLTDADGNRIQPDPIPAERPDGVDPNEPLTSNQIGDAGERVTGDRARQRVLDEGGQYVGAEVTITVDVDGIGPVTIRADHVTIDGNGQIVIWESKAKGANTPGQVGPGNFTENQTVVFEAIKSGNVNDVRTSNNAVTEALNRLDEGIDPFGKTEIHTFTVN